MPWPGEPRHPIRVVSQRTGLSPATLRAWERRYAVVSPSRSEGGQRLYSDEDVRKLTRLRMLTEAGRSISLVASLSDAEAEALLEEDLASSAPPTRVQDGNGQDATQVVHRALRLVDELDGDGLESWLRKAALTLGAQPFLEEVLTPLLHSVGAAWTRDELHTAHEHLCTSVTQRVLHWLKEPVSAGAGGPRLIAATLSGERHGLGTMLVAAAAGLEGWHVTNLGTDLPAHDIARAARALRARAVAVSVVHMDNPSGITRELDKLREALPSDTALLLGGGGVAKLGSASLPDGAQVIPTLGSLREALRRL